MERPADLGQCPDAKLGSGSLVKSPEMRSKLNGAGEFVTVLRDGFGNATQHALALEGGQAASGSESLYGGGDGSFGMLAPRLDHSPKYAAIEGGADLDDVAIFHPPAVDKETVGCDWGKRHFRHFYLLYANSVFDYRPWLAVAFF